MNFSVPAGNALRFEAEDGTPLDAPLLSPITRVVSIGLIASVSTEHTAA